MKNIEMGRGMFVTYMPFCGVWIIECCADLMPANQVDMEGQPNWSDWLVPGTWVEKDE